MFICMIIMFVQLEYAYPSQQYCSMSSVHLVIGRTMAGKKVINSGRSLLVVGLTCLAIVPLHFTVLKATLAGGYTDWSEWGPCSAECGEGKRIRIRNCTNPRPGSFGKTCLDQKLGNPSEKEKCKIKECPIDGGLTEWSAFGDCDKTCGNGAQKRTRSCANPPPQFNGRVCEGTTEETRACNVKPCPVDGGFTAWTVFGECDKPCGTGIRKRTRTCSNPPPANGGENCEGPFEEEEKCNLHPCPVDGGFTFWGEFNACSKTCGRGVQIRMRNCTNPVPANGGKNCDGPLQETKACNIDPCPTDAPAKKPK